jgi:hypothetical protein
LSDPRSWLEARTPPPPPGLTLPSPESLAPGPLPESLTTAATSALARALAGSGERRGAFDLLAADALLTYACEAAAEAGDPEATLHSLVEQVGRGRG